MSLRASRPTLTLVGLAATALVLAGCSSSPSPAAATQPSGALAATSQPPASPPASAARSSASPTPSPARTTATAKATATKSATAPATRAASTPASATPAPTKASPKPSPTTATVLSASHPCAGSAAPARWSHVIWIVMENKAASSIYGSGSAPAENALVRACGSASNYRGVAHPSLPNYIALTSGSTQGITDDNPPSAHPLGAASLFSELGGRWATYAESMPSPCDLTSSGQYAVKHNPAAYFTNLRSTCASHDIALGTPSTGAFASGLRSNTLPAFSLVIPNLCNDTHNCSVATGDAWLKAWFQAIFNSPAYRAGSTAVFVTWDEDDSSSGNRVALIAAAPSIRPGTVTGAAFTHISLLRTTEEMLGLGARLGAAAASMRAALHL